MLSEKLLLDLLITLSPILVYSVLLEKKNVKFSLASCGILAGIASSLCLIFTYNNYGFHWDLRYVTIVLAYLYCGPIAGGIAIVMNIITRTIMGGKDLVFAYICGALSIIPPMMIHKNFCKYERQKRIKVAMIVGIWPLLVSISGLLIFNWQRGYLWHSITFGFNLVLFGLLNIVGMGLSARLMEGLAERKQMKVEIEKAEKLNTLGELAASIAHEIRNPLTVVKGFLQLMQQEEKGRNYEYLTLVLNELGRAESIINDYLNFAKPKFEKIEEFQIVDALNEVFLLLEPLAIKKGVLLEKVFDRSYFCMVTDQNQLKQALINLVKNAIEATDLGGVVTIRLAILESNAMIQIIDTGKGMTKEQLTRIGTLFYTTKEKGTGLGTSVSIRIIETMNGSVSFKSQPGIGTEVTMIF